MRLPILTLPDPVISGEGALDPLGVATISDRLAERVLPGLRARMSRPRFLTAMAVSAAVCDGMDDLVAKDGVTPPFIVFEWLVVEGFARAATRDDTRYTPGMLKAQAVRASGEPMRASAYLRIPNIFGFHGIYKPLGRNLGIVDEDMRLGDAGYTLLKTWQAEQALDGFLPTDLRSGPGTAFRETLRSAVNDALAKGCTDRSGGWRGWPLIANHLAPGRIGRSEAALIQQMLLDQSAGTRGEVFSLLEARSVASESSEAQVVRDVLMANASADLRSRLAAISAFEAVCTRLECLLEWLRYLSSHAGARAITPAEFAAIPEVRAACALLPEAIRTAEDAVAQVPDPLPVQQEFRELAKAFDGPRTPEQWFESVLTRHHDVQQAKKPDGKRDWFERNPDGAAFVRVPYRVTDAPIETDAWNRPYRIQTVLSFLDDLRVGAYEPA